MTEPNKPKELREIPVSNFNSTLGIVLTNGEMAQILKWVDEVIGEDENTKAKDLSGLRPWLFDVPAQMRNDLRAEQRRRAGLK